MNAEITIRLEGDVLMAIDAAAKHAGLSSRNAAIERILHRWHQAWLQHELDRQTEAYYKSLTSEENEDDRLWARFSSEQAMQRWDEQ